MPTDFFEPYRKIKTIKTPVETPFDISHGFFTNIQITNNIVDINSASVEIDEQGFYDILDLNKQIETVLSKQPRLSKDDFDKKCEKFEWIINNSTDAKEKRDAKDHLFNMKQNLQYADQLTKFRERSQKLISQYRSACENSSTFYFEDMLIEINTAKKLMQQEYLSIFLSICQEYVSVKTSNKNQLTWSCCSNPKILSDGGRDYCANCPTTFVTVDNFGSFNDQKRIATTTTSKYYNIKHFVSAVKKSQGIHKKNIDPEIDKLQDDYMAHHNIKLEDYTIFHLMDLLSRNASLSKNYKDVHLIYRQKTGKQINNLGNVERDLPRWYKEQDKYSDTIKLKEDSKNSINAYYMVCRLAQLCGGRIDLDLKNFFCARDEDTIAEYDTCFEARCYKLGWLKEGEKLKDVIGN